MLQITLDHKKKRDEQQEPDQYFIHAGVVRFVKGFVAPVNPDRASYENDKKNDGENQLACGKHVDSILPKVKDLLRVSIIFT